MDSAVRTHALSKKYGNKSAVVDLDLDVPAGSVYALLGLNGAGKSTILKMLIGLTRPTSGSGFCLGMDILSEGRQLREKVGYMGEEPRLYGYMTVKQVISFCRGLYRQWEEPLVERYLELFELPAQNKIHELSQGMKNQLALILSLAPRPELLLLDEPTEGFDPVKRRLFYSAVLKEVVSEGKTVVIATNRLDDVERVADQVGLLRRGSLVRACSLDELKSQEKEIRVVFQKEPPVELLQQPGVRQVLREGSAYRVIVSYRLEEIWQSFAAYPHYVLEVISTDLEEIFLRHVAEEENGDD
ncbi:MAG: ABC transporter ATP-binding protein [Dethiobacter sp.]|jgi:ABC-2 type transport system ATP-binding protein|nr:MAG: ABC transporter ATP-binding protein [Dethiobacter sp.]